MTPFWLNQARARLAEVRPRLAALEVPGLPPGYVAGYVGRNEAAVLDLLAIALLERETLDRTLLHSFTGGAGRWAHLRTRGATDQDLLDALARELGDGGGHGLGDPTESDYVDYNGGKQPTIALNTRWDRPGHHKKTWRGKALLAAVRRHLDIGLPGPDPSPSPSEAWWVYDKHTPEQLRALKVAKGHTERNAAATKLPPEVA